MQQDFFLLFLLLLSVMTLVFQQVVNSPCLALFHAFVCYWFSLLAGLSRLISNWFCLRCFLRFILVRSFSNTSPERRADTKSSNSPLSLSSLAFLAFCSLSLFSWKKHIMVRNNRDVDFVRGNRLVTDVCVYCDLQQILPVPPLEHVFPLLLCV